ncbi:MAG: hypothetical protein JWN62_4557 [Acidimicrobiales bacterium]|nr:hypothetical protein [Acidimicrobiales bacterium]
MLAPNDVLHGATNEHKATRRRSPLLGQFLTQSFGPLAFRCSVPSNCGLPTGRAVDEFAKDVGVARVAGSFFEEMGDDPP